MTDGGPNEANLVLRNCHKQAIAEANKARDIERDVINQLSGLRADLVQKIKDSFLRILWLQESFVFMNYVASLSTRILLHSRAP